jgi:hypothetical protein
MLARAAKAERFKPPAPRRTPAFKVRALSTWWGCLVAGVIGGLISVRERLGSWAPLRRHTRGAGIRRRSSAIACGANHRFLLSFREVEEMMMERGVVVFYETLRRHCQAVMCRV